jgi:hypothetical protein
MKFKWLSIAVFAFTPCAVAQDQKIFGDFQKIKLEDDIHWIDESPQRPEEYVGQVFLVVKKDNSTIPYFAPIPVPVLVEDTPSVKKSILIKSNKDGSISFLDIFKIGAQKENVYQFQIVHSRKWSADTKNKEFLKAISQFRNDNMTSNIFDSTEYSGIVMVSAVVAKRIWYKTFKKDGGGGVGIYFVKVEGNDYSSSEDFEEVIRFGFLLRPLSGFGIVLPKTIVNTEQVINTNVKVPAPALKNVSAFIKTMIVQ